MSEIQVGGRATCRKCGEDYDMADIHQCEPTPSAAEKHAIQFIAEYENGDCSSELVTEALDRVLRGYSKTLREIKEDEDAMRYSGQAVDRQEDGLTGKTVHDLAKELSAERQRAEQAENIFAAVTNGEDILQTQIERDLLRADRDDKNRQLLSAQAAIEKHNHKTVEDGFGSTIESVDLSLLHRHDAELTEKVRKPLVLAIENMMSFCPDAVQNMARHALALVKEKP